MNISFLIYILTGLIPAVAVTKKKLGFILKKSSEKAPEVEENFPENPKTWPSGNSTAMFNVTANDLFAGWKSDR